ncbi:MAG TPA: sugar ABC transporter permease [Kaistia sp.]|nr:sugar ABC transporter permease [Kaistia sp.]
MTDSPSRSSSTNSRRAAKRPAAGEALSPFKARHLLYLLPGLAIYIVFSIVPILQTLEYSFYRWDGITPARWVGMRNYVALLTNPKTLSTFGHGLVMILFYAVLPTLIALFIVAIMTRVRIRLLGFFRTVLFLPQILATVVVAVAWRWIYANDGPINGVLDFLGLGFLSRAWLGDFDTALPAVGLIGTWVSFGLCMVLFIGGVQRIDRGLYEAARLDGAGPFREFMAITLPSLQGEISIALILGVTNALRNFDIVWNTTSGGPGTSTLVPSYFIYEAAFIVRNVGLASAAAVLLTLVILLMTGAIGRTMRQRH